MASQRKSKPSSEKSRPPAKTPEARESQLIALAYDEAERQMREGTASSQVITQFLKLGSSREKLEQQKIALDNQFTETKTEMMESAKRVEAMYAEALQAMRSYAGQEPLDEPDEYDD